ncbi:MAG TPA: hypothetical protein VFQ67_06220 [Allosphingosinicella sp.]|jgi:hypothetical protein|nr:hypothetical protein [Allosphingosinicella sp.]
MSKDRDGGTVDNGGASEPIRVKDGDRSPAGRERGESSSAADPAPIDLDTVRDRAS